MSIEINARQDGADYRMHTVGRLDAQSASALRDALKAIPADSKQVWLDLSKVPFIDSTGLAALISGLKSIRTHEGKLILVGITPEVMRIFQVTLLDRVFTFVDTMP
jgi:anti-sigma B factor antagonist